ncbi:MAG: NAD(P)-dependent oxidoreductase [Christensenellales bacterium]|jgi:3-hydroxyisobutyrate dehydrogenase-like beta-hydroxyacid dehydrogenase
MKEKAKIAWIGTGNMGSRMAKRLIDEGHLLTVYDSMPDHTQDLVNAGAYFAENPAVAAADAEFVFSMIPGSSELLDVVTGKEGITQTIKKGSIVIDMSTVAPEASSAANEAISAKGCAFLRAPVTGSTVFAEQGILGIICSGDKTAYGKTLPLFEILGNKQYYVGQNEESRYMKLAINIMMGTICQMLAEALVFGERSGLDWAQMLDIFSESAAGAPLIKYKSKPLKDRDFNPAFTIKLMEKDLDLALEIARKTDLSLPVTSLVRQFLASARATGRGDLDFSALVLLAEDMAGLSH